MTTQHHIRFAPLLVASIGLLATACTLDKGKLETSISDEFKSKDIPLKSVTCPEGRKIKQDDKFDCTAETQDGDKVTLHVTQTDSQGSIKWELDGKILDEAKEGDDIEGEISKKLGVKADVQCPKKTIILAEGKTFTCDVKVDDQTKKVDITLGASGYNWEIK